MGYLYIAMSIGTGLLTLYWSFKAKQSAGVARRNDVETHYGGGSFRTGISSGVMSIVWGILAFAAGSGCLIAIAQANSAFSVDKASAKEALDPLSQTAILVPPGPQVATPTEPVEQKTEKEAVAAKEATLPTAPVQQTDAVQAIPVPQASSELPTVTEPTLVTPPAEEVRPISIDGNAIQVCESASNFITQNNCRWEQCAKAENKSRPECERFQKRQR